MPTVRIHIDREPYESPNPTTGGALYARGNVAPHRDLFREVEGDDEDELISRDSTEVKLKQDEHFYSQKVITIIVNAQQKEVVEPYNKEELGLVLAKFMTSKGYSLAYYKKNRSDRHKNALKHPRRAVSNCDEFVTIYSKQVC